MAVLSSAANGGSVASTQKLGCLTWGEETTVEVETCGRAYWSFLQRARAIDNKQLGNVSAFLVADDVEEEVGAAACGCSNAAIIIWLEFVKWSGVCLCVWLRLSRGQLSLFADSLVSERDSACLFTCFQVYML